MSGPLLRAAGPAADPALERTREQVKMLDELYKNAYVATVVPAVTKKCAKCHGVNEGDLLGFIRYEVPIK